MKKIISLLFVLAVLIMLMPIPVYADMGPKPSIVITVDGLNENKCYATVLFNESSVNGPHRSWEEFSETDIEYLYDGKEKSVFFKFADFKDADGYVFTGIISNLTTEDNKFSLGYYPPYQFKALLYFPDTDTYALSDVMERYAFDSFYTVFFNGANHANGESAFSMSHKDTPLKFWLPLVCGFVIRLALTVLIETVIAVPFFLRNKKQFFIILWVNALTQALLNLSLNFMYITVYAAFKILLYALFEFIVFVAEAIIYKKLLPKYEKPNAEGVMGSKKSRYVCYALIANFVSFIVGLVLSEIVPTWF